MMEAGSEEKKQKLLRLLELPMYHKWHASLDHDLTQTDKLFDRNMIGISQTDADRIYAVTGCRTLEQYLVRLALNDQVFTGLLKKSIKGNIKKAVTLIDNLREMV